MVVGNNRAYAYGRLLQLASVAGADGINGRHSRKIQGISPISVSSKRIRSEIPAQLCGRSNEFPEIENRELIPTSREFVGIRSGL